MYCLNTIDQYFTLTNDNYTYTSKFKVNHPNEKFYLLVGNGALEQRDTVSLYLGYSKFSNPLPFGYRTIIMPDAPLCTVFHRICSFSYFNYLYPVLIEL